MALSMIIIKFGGSVITDKSRSFRFRAKDTERLVTELKSYQRAISKSRPTLKAEQLILVHGAGSFGHILANKYKLDEGFKSPKQLIRVAEVKKDVRELNLKVIKILIAHSLNPISISPSSIIVNNSKVIDSIDMTAFEHLMKLQFIPVTFGDIVMDKKLGFSICSGDQIILHLAKNFKPDKVIFVTNVDGLLANPPTDPKSQKLIEEINITSRSDLALVKSVKAKMKVADVTGGILTKLKISMEIAKYGIESYIINGRVKNRLRNCLLDRDITGTRIHG